MKKLLLTLVGVVCSLGMWAAVDLTQAHTWDFTKITANDFKQANGTVNGDYWVDGHSWGAAYQCYCWHLTGELSVTNGDGTVFAPFDGLTVYNSKANYLYVYDDGKGASFRNGNGYFALSLTKDQSISITYNSKSLSCNNITFAAGTDLSVITGQTVTGTVTATGIVKIASNQGYITKIQIGVAPVVVNVEEPVIKSYWHTVAMSCATDGASIYYTTDGTTPSATNGTLYAGTTFALNSACTIKAIAVKEGLTASQVVEVAHDPKTAGATTGTLLATFNNTTESTDKTAVADGILTVNGITWSKAASGANLRYRNESSTHGLSIGISGAQQIQAPANMKITSVKITGHNLQATATAIKNTWLATFKSDDNRITEAGFTANHTLAQTNNELIYGDIAIGGTYQESSIVLTTTDQSWGNSIAFAPGTECGISVEVYGETCDLTANINAKGYATFSYFSETKVPEGVTAYTGTVDEDAPSITWTKIEDGIIPANEGVLLKGEPGEITLSASSTSKAKIDGNQLKPNLTQKTTAQLGEFIYVLSGEDIMRLGDGGTLKASRAYFQLTKDVTETSGAKSFTMIWNDGEATGINNVNASAGTAQAAYNLAGQRVNANSKGIVIMNGKKYINK